MTGNRLQRFTFFSKESGRLTFSVRSSKFIGVGSTSIWMSLKLKSRSPSFIWFAFSKFRSEFLEYFQGEESSLVIIPYRLLPWVLSIGEMAHPSSLARSSPNSKPKPSSRASEKRLSKP